MLFEFSDESTTKYLSATVKLLPKKSFTKIGIFIDKALIEGEAFRGSKISPMAPMSIAAKPSHSLNIE